MFYEAGAPHHEPHFHAYYQKCTAVFALSPVRALAGDLPARQRRMVEVWAALHEDELRLAWARLQFGFAPQPIEPLP